MNLQTIRRKLYDRYWNARVHAGDWLRVKRRQWKNRKHHGATAGQVTLTIHPAKHE